MLENQNNSERSDRLIIELLNQNEELKFKIDKILNFTEEGGYSFGDLIEIAKNSAERSDAQLSLYTDSQEFMLNAFSTLIVFFGVIIAFKISDLFFKVAFKK